MTLADLFADPALLPAAKAWFKDVQTKDQHYQPVLTAADKPQITINAATMAQFRPAMAKFYYDEKKYPTYLEQLAIKWPSVPVGR
ncbi:MAG: hypothetical protein H7268_11625 [Sandarakinorhabdus sp.]|nr:hypothetical protein [Sandarakinorhabdus sp.]